MTEVAPIALSAELTSSASVGDSTVQVAIALRNRSALPVWVNKRMGVGYEDGLVREIYFTVCDEAGNALPVPDDARVDVHRMPPSMDDFTQLEPGAAVSATVDLAMWYPFRPGRYRVTISYENIWDGREFGIDAFTGHVSADPLSTEIR